MKGLFSGLTRLSLRFRLVTLILALLISVAGIIAITQLRQELIPAVEFPQTTIFAQTTGLTSEQVLNLITNPIEQGIDAQIEEITSVESTTTGSFGAIITAYNDFGLNQPRLRAEIQQVLDSLSIPLRRIQAPADQAPEAFAASLLADLTPDVLIYLAENDANMLFQLSPEVWGALSPETLNAVVAYLADQTEQQSTNPLLQLIEQEVSPALVNLPLIASVSVSGGQQLPDESGSSGATESTVTARSVLLSISPEVWTIASQSLFGEVITLDDAAIERVRAIEYSIPNGAPQLPASWQMDRFFDASDLEEMSTLTRTIGAVLNSFVNTGEIVGSLGQTNDLTPEVVTAMLAIDPTLVNYFKAEHLAAMSSDVFNVLPAEFIEGLDGFTRDQLAARTLAGAITGELANPVPVDLPQPWRIAPPQLITFSFDDLPLATFSVAGTGDMISAGAPTEAGSATTDAPAESAADAPVVQEVPEGPRLPLQFGFIGLSLGLELDTADDLINLELPESAAAQFGATSLPPAQLFNFLALLQDPESLPEGVSLPIAIDPAAIISAIDPEVFTFIAQYDPEFLSTLSADIYDWMSDEALAIAELAPPLDQVWDALASQPQFSENPLDTAADLVALGNGSAASVLNQINASVPEGFEGYEVRLFDSLSPGTLRYLALQESGFYSNLDPEVLAKFSPAGLAIIPADVLASLDPELAARLTSIASGETASAATDLAALYQTDAPPEDPNAPAVNSEWQFVGDFVGVELNSADDFFRFFPNPANFFNSMFDSAQGAAFAEGLFGNMPPEAISYVDTRGPDIWNNVIDRALLLMSDEGRAALPTAIQERLASGGERFEPTAAITRTNGSSSMFITVYQADDANTVEAFHAADAVMQRIDAENDGITVTVGFEQASFIEESISGVAREGGLGAIFAILVILVFLSGGAAWRRGARAGTGAVVAAVFLALLLILTINASNATGGDLGAAFNQLDVVIRVLLIGGVVIGLAIWLYPGNIPRPAWRSTLVTAMSIPLSVLMAFMLMRWLPPIVNGALAPLADGSPLISFLLRLFPESITINIMTLSGLTVAIGRVVDDSIVVLENIFRQIQEGGDRKQAIITGTRDVSVAIFAATVITVVVFLPLGLTGGIISEFFLPFGLAVTYSLLSSFVVAVTIVPVLAYLLLDENEVAHEHEQSWLEKLYLPVLHWALSGWVPRLLVIGAAIVSFVLAIGLLLGRPQTFLPSFGEPQLSVAVELPSGTSILESNRLAEEFEAYIETLPEGEIARVQTIVGSAGFTLQSLLLGGADVSENVLSITLAVEVGGEALNNLTREIRTEAERIFGADYVTVSAASISEQGLGGFQIIVAGEQTDIVATNEQIIAVLNGVDGLANVSSNLDSFGGAGGTATTYLRVNGRSAVQFTGELETQNTLGVSQDAIQAILDAQAAGELPATLSVEQGFTSELQSEGFTSVGRAMAIAIVFVVVILIITFGSFVHWLDIISSVAVAPVGAAILLTLGNRVLGISALIGMLMLIGIVVTNAVVLIDRVQANRRERKMNVTDALMEAGDRRLRPILMTAIATIFALVPLAVGLSEGAIIASELGTVVIGGLFSSTLLTLILVPVLYSTLSGKKASAAKSAVEPAVSGSPAD